MSIAQNVINGLIQGSLYALFAASFTIIFGVMDIPNMAHGAMFAVGAYVFYQVYEILALPWFVALACSIVVVGALGAAIERGFLDRLYGRDDSEYVFGVILVTFGLGLIIERFIGQFWGYDNLVIEMPLLQDHAFLVAGVSVTLAQIVIILFGVGSFAFLYWFSNHTLMGHSLRAIVQDRELAYMKGIDVERVFLYTFVLGSAMISIAGVLYGTMFTLSPDMGFNLLIKSFIIVILGGIGSIFGAGIAGFGLGMYEAFAIAYLDSYYIFASEFLLLIAYVLLKSIVTDAETPILTKLLAYGRSQ